MSNAIAVTPTVISHRVTPWIGTGTAGEWTNVGDALCDSGLDFTVEQTCAYDAYGNDIPGILVNHDSTTHKIVGVTSDQYGVVQNADAFSLLDPFCSIGGIIEHAGMTMQGMCFMVMRVPGAAFGFMGDDFEMFVCAMNSFNTKFPLALIITPVRVVCQNMFRKLMKRGDTVLMIKHGRFAADRILSASKASSLLLDYEDDFVASLRASRDQERSYSDVYRFAELMFPYTPETPEHPRAKFTNERMDLMRRQFMSDYYHAPDNEKYEGTRLGIINAYYDWVTHNVPARASENYDQIRFGNLMSGSAVNSRLIDKA